MFRRITGISFTLLLAFGILFASIFRTAQIKYSFVGPKPLLASDSNLQNIEVDYQLPSVGRVLPDSLFWPFKAAYDRVRFLVTAPSLDKAKLSLFYADQRLSAAKILFEKDKADLGFSTLTKAEKYLEQASNLEKKARGEGSDTSFFLTTMAQASLKHRATLEEISQSAPDDAKAQIIKIQDYSKAVFKEISETLISKDMHLPENPFSGG